ncbi:MAG: hypothetical protein J07HQW2_02633 [Haloquadratum walsbyi J07HQW2]|uniref:Uncharacterized protein n=1 Tax=Haloquadratum walsbyi J07HQW2 TaxID=1238425 RepID=U1NH16_9EURY|nr:MAG: hypothetical protein J07HQW2_02633 [Haloquadratum walsbyi J07HQW2]
MSDALSLDEMITVNLWALILKYLFLHPVSTLKPINTLFGNKWLMTLR